MKIKAIIYFLTIMPYLLFGQADLADVQRSVVTILSSAGNCNGVLLNNTSNDGKPLVLTARHCFSDPSQTIFFTFNRDILVQTPSVKSVEWTTSSKRILAESIDQDFVLYELEEEVPPYLRPYFSGWSASARLPLMAYGIHNLDDNLQLNKESNTPQYETLDEIEFYGGTPVTNGSIWIRRWEAGYTDFGSSGSPLYDQDGVLRGILSAGASTEENPVNDFYVRFDLIYDLSEDPNSSIFSYLNESEAVLEELDGYEYPTSRLSNFLNYPTDLLFQNSTLVEEMFEQSEVVDVYGVYLVVGEVLPGDIVNVSLVGQSSILAQSQVFSQDLTPYSENFISLDTTAIEGEFSILVESTGSIALPFAENSSNNVLRVGTSEFENTSALISILTSEISESNTTQTDPELLLYPVPTSDNLFISGAVEVETVGLLDSEGKEIPISIRRILDGAYLINLTDQKDGLYYLKTGSQTHKVIIRR